MLYDNRLSLSWASGILLLMALAMLLCPPAWGQAQKIDEAKLDQKQLATVKETFARLDANHDGMVTKVENPDQDMRTMDVNGDGSVTLDEAIAMLVPVDESKLDTAQLAVVKGRFRDLDANKDGRVTPQEFPEPGFKRLDLNNDGFITLVESVSVLVPLAKANPQPAQPAQPGRVSEETVRQTFKFKDKDGDGKLTPEEVNNPDQFKQLDANKDGVVTVEEAIALYAAPNAAPANADEQRFKQLDKNGDGTLTRPEANLIVFEFNWMDANKDGGISQEEYLKARQWRPTVGPDVSFTPLTALGKNAYKGAAGGLYPDGANVPPADYLAKGLAAAKTVQPLNKDGQPDPNGVIGLVAIGMSNASMEYAAFKTKADAEPTKNPRVQIVNCAFPGVETTRMRDPKDAYWTMGLDMLLNKAGVSCAQAQVIWLKQATGFENRPFPDDANGLKADLATILDLLKARFPNLKLVYVSSRTYGGYATIALNPEPAAYDGGFGVKWFIEARMKAVDGPWVAWGPYLWTDGTRGRADKLTWNREDTGADGTHPSPIGCAKVAGLLWQFFSTDDTTKGWFLQ